jgi:hypothetical protein
MGILSMVAASLKARSNSSLEELLELIENCKNNLTVQPMGSFAKRTTFVITKIKEEIEQ